MATFTPMTVSFTGGKIIETPDVTGVQKEIMSLVGSLTAQIETTGRSVFTLPPSTTDETIYIGNIATAKLLVLNPDNEIQVKFNGSATAISLEGGPSVMFGTFSGLVVTNPSPTLTVNCEMYACSNVT